jgi:hypothetical protein
LHINWQEVDPESAFSVQGLMMSRMAGISILYWRCRTPFDNPALMAAQMSAQVSRVMHGRKVDVRISAPNLMHLPIHDVAFKEGQLL